MFLSIKYNISTLHTCDNIISGIMYFVLFCHIVILMKATLFSDLILYRLVDCRLVTFTIVLLTQNY